MVIVMMWLVLYDINYIYRRKTPRFVDYDEVEAGKITQSFTFLLKDIINYIHDSTGSQSVAGFLISF